MTEACESNRAVSSKCPKSCNTCTTVSYDKRADSFGNSPITLVASVQEEVDNSYITLLADSQEDSEVTAQIDLASRSLNVEEIWDPIIPGRKVSYEESIEVADNITKAIVSVALLSIGVCDNDKIKDQECHCVFRSYLIVYSCRSVAYGSYDLSKRSRYHTYCYNDAVTETQRTKNCCRASMSYLEAKKCTGQLDDL